MQHLCATSYCTYYLLCSFASSNHNFLRKLSKLCLNLWDILWKLNPWSVVQSSTWQKQGGGVLKETILLSSICVDSDLSEGQWTVLLLAAHNRVGTHLVTKQLKWAVVRKHSVGCTLTHFECAVGFSCDGSSSLECLLGIELNFLKLCMHLCLWRSILLKFVH